MTPAKVLKSKTIFNSLSCKALKATLDYRVLPVLQVNLVVMVNKVFKDLLDLLVKTVYKVQKVTQALLGLKVNRGLQGNEVQMVSKDHRANLGEMELTE